MGGGSIASRFCNHCSDRTEQRRNHEEREGRVRERRGGTDPEVGLLFIFLGGKERSSAEPVCVAMHLGGRIRMSKDGNRPIDTLPPATPHMINLLSLCCSVCPAQVCVRLIAEVRHLPHLFFLPSLSLSLRFVSTYQYEKKGKQELIKLFPSKYPRPAN